MAITPVQASFLDKEELKELDRWETTLDGVIQRVFHGQEEIWVTDPGVPIRLQAELMQKYIEAGWTITHGSDQDGAYFVLSTK